MPDPSPDQSDGRFADALARARSAIDTVAGQAERFGGPELGATLATVRRVLDAVDAPRPAGTAAPPTSLFDVSDLFGYFPDNRLPTGVQRVQTSVILAMLDRHRADGSVGLVRFIEGRDEWLAVPVELFRETVLMSMAGGDAGAPDWRAIVARLDQATRSGRQIDFAAGTTIVNLGTSWWSYNYFMHLRQAKERYGLRYVPLIYDMIPVVTPQYCGVELIQDFIDWLMGVIRHGDRFLAISDATKDDFRRLAGELGWPVAAEHVAVLPLQAEVSHAEIAKSDGGTVLTRNGLTPGSYVLIVSTIEARKNQVAAFDAWQQLVNRHGAAAMPSLVCVGKPGYRHEDILGRRAQSADLVEKVAILHHVDDTDLEALYRNCRFTLYPSFYEGWGLPVTESLAFGKVPLTADNSSLPQAGQGLSVMYESGSRAALVQALEQMIFDEDFRREAEARIAREFTPRGWSDVAADLERAVAGFGGGGGGWTPPRATPGYYPLKRNRATRLAPGIATAEPFRHDGFWRLEDFVCWTMPRGAALRFLLDPGPQRIGVQLAGLPGQATDWLVESEGVEVRGSLAAQAVRWAFVDIPAERPDGPVTLRVSSRRSETAGDVGSTRGREIAIGLLGFYVFDLARPDARLEFLEAAALGTLQPASGMR